MESPTHIPQVGEAASFLENLTEAAPMVAALVAIVAAFLLFLWRVYVAWQKQEDARESRAMRQQEDRDSLSETRHNKYFEHLDHIGDGCHKVQEEATVAIHENTRVLGEVAETNRNVDQALRRLEK